jgi:hypothetical protein
MMVVVMRVIVMSVMIAVMMRMAGHLERRS